MIDFLWSLSAFVVALGILVAVHEWGHFFVARRCGVHVIRFSIGFGKPLWRRTDKQGTEYVIAAIPLGGYVRMLDERVDNVPANKSHQAFNQQSVGKRMAIIAAGPAVNFVFAIFAFWLMFMIGVLTFKPLVGDVTNDSIAANAGLQPMDQIVAVGDRQTPDWPAVTLELMSYIGESNLPVTLLRANGVTQQVNLDTTYWQFDPDQQSAIDSLGMSVFRPSATLKIANVGENTPASVAGLMQGDIITKVSTTPVESWQEAVDVITENPGNAISITVQRDNQEKVVVATLAAVETDRGTRGYLGVAPESEPWPDGVVFIHQYGMIAALSNALDQTWRFTIVSLEMIGKLFTGDVSVKSLSGPISIAQGAGTSAEYGIVQFLKFLAIISVSLGIINLLPIPMLDGGHLMYFIVEWLTGKPVPESVQEIGFRIGGMLLLMLMGIALFNDITRLG